MRQRYSLSSIIIVVLIAIGLLASLRALFIPILVLGIIFLLYKFPPSRWNFRAGARSQARGKSKTAKFRVIPGSKDREPDDYPKYH